MPVPKTFTQQKKSAHFPTFDCTLPFCWMNRLLDAFSSLYVRILSVLCMWRICLVYTHFDCVLHFQALIYVILLCFAWQRSVESTYSMFPFMILTRGWHDVALFPGFWFRQWRLKISFQVGSGVDSLMNSPDLIAQYFAVSGDTAGLTTNAAGEQAGRYKLPCFWSGRGPRRVMIERKWVENWTWRVQIPSEMHLFFFLPWQVVHNRAKGSANAQLGHLYQSWVS